MRLPPTDRRTRLAVLALVALALVPSAARAEEAVPPTWRFPEPFTFSSPLPDPLSLGMGIGVGTGDAGWGVALPISLMLTYGQTAEAAGYLAAGYRFPLLIHAPTDGDTALYAGNLAIDFRGAWKLDLGGVPGAWGAGFDLGIPLASIWGHAGDYGPQLGQTMFPYDPVSWLSGYLGVAPKALFAVGPPLYFLEASAALPCLIAIADRELTRTEFLGTWVLALGSRPHDMVTITAEGGGIHSLPGRDFHGELFKAQELWAGLGAKVYVSLLDAGLFARVPFGDPHVLGGSPKFIILLTLGTTRRCCPKEGSSRGVW